MLYRTPIPKVCERARTYASLALDGELSDFERVLLDSHLAGCAACSAFSADVGATTAALRAAAFESLERPLQLPVRVRAGLRRLHVGAAAAVLVTIVGAGSLLGQLGESDQSRFQSFRNVEPATPSLRELRASDLRPASVLPAGQKILEA